MINVDYLRDHLSGLNDPPFPFQNDLPSLFQNDLPSPFQTGVAIPFAVLNSQRPRFDSSPNDYSFSSFSNSFGLQHEVLVECSIVVRANVHLDSHFSSHWVLHDKKKEYFYSVANLSYNYASDTTFLPTDATTSHLRKRFLLQRRGLHRHTSQAPPPTSAVLKIRLAEA